MGESSPKKDDHRAPPSITVEVAETDYVRVDKGNKYCGDRHENVRSDVIEISEAILENVLLKHQDLVASRLSWTTPLSVFLTCLAVLVSAEFEDVLGLDRHTWKALFLLVGLFTLYWTGRCGVKAYNSRKSCTIPDLMDRIRGKSLQGASSEE